jgi:anti-sigma B factor antagonist
MASRVGMRRLGGVESAEFEIVVDTTGAGRRIAVRGDLDLATVESLRPALENALEAREPTTLELSQCTFLDSSALKAIADASRRADETGIAFSVARPSPQAARVLEVSGLDEIVRIDAGEYP